MKIALDMMGGDFAPLEAIKGIEIYLQNKNADTTLFPQPWSVSPPTTLKVLFNIN